MKRSLIIFLLFTSAKLVAQAPSSFTWQMQDEFSPCIQFHNTNTAQINYIWSFGDTISSQSTAQDPFFCYSDTGCYNVKLWVQDNFGNEDSTTHTVCVRNESVLFIPNAFSPNGDAINDVFYVYGYLIPEHTYEMRIYSNWGGLVYTSFDIHQGWDGRANLGENKIQQGAYLLELTWYDVHNERHTYRGFIMLLI